MAEKDADIDQYTCDTPTWSLTVLLFAPWIFGFILRAVRIAVIYRIAGLPRDAAVLAA